MRLRRSSSRSSFRYLTRDSGAISPSGVTATNPCTEASAQAAKLPGHRSATAVALSQYPTLCQALGVATYAFELGFPLILLIHATGLRLAFFAGVTFFHVANYVLIGVQFLYVPILFAIFFDLSAPLRWWSERHRAPVADSG